MTPDLSHCWEGEREKCEDNNWDEEQEKKCTVAGHPGGLVVTLAYYKRWSLSSIPTVVRFDFICKNATKKRFN